MCLQFGLVNIIFLLIFDNFVEKQFLKLSYLFTTLSV